MKYFTQIKKEGTRDKLSVSVSVCVFFLADLPVRQAGLAD